MIAGFIALRLDSGFVTRAMNYLWQLFKKADLNHDSELSRDEVAAGFYGDEVKEKLASLGFEMPDWLALFDAIDMDGDGSWSWDELYREMIALWADDPAEALEEEEEEGLGRGRRG